MVVKAILGIVPGLQATSLVAYNMPKNFKMKPSKDMGIKRIVGKGVGTLAGVALIKPTASMINAL